MCDKRVETLHDFGMGGIDFGHPDLTMSRLRSKVGPRPEALYQATLCFRVYPLSTRMKDLHPTLTIRLLLFIG
jgi:hypothetical protein